MKRSLLLTMLLYFTYSTYAQQILKDIRSGQDGSEPGYENAIMHNGYLYFTADEIGTYRALYRTDGTTGGTEKLLGDVNFNVFNLYGFLNNELIFTAGNFTDGSALYKTSGTNSSYTLIKQLNTVDLISFGAGSAALGNHLYFIGADETHGFELWKTDGTTAGTEMVKDINPGSGNGISNISINSNFGKLGNILVFSANDSTYGAELWKTDGTEAGTTILKDIESNNSLGAFFGSNPTYFTLFNGKLYFSAYRTVDGRELWVTDGTTNGTQLVKDLATGDGYPKDFVVWNGALYFNAYATNESYTLWKTDGTANGTNTVKLPSAGGPDLLSKITVFKNKLAFIAASTSGTTSVWLSDGTSAGTAAVSNNNLQFYSVGDLVLATSNYFYFAGSNSNGTFNLYRSEGTANSLQQLTSGSNFDIDLYQPFYLMNNCVHFVATDGTTGKEPYTVCNQQTVGINHIESLAVQLYPNPANHLLNVTTSSNEELALHVYNLSGNVVMQTTVVNNLNLDIAQLTSGFYFIELKAPNGVSTRLKFIKE